MLESERCAGRTFWKCSRVFCRLMLWCVIWCAALVRLMACWLRPSGTGTSSAPAPASAASSPVPPPLAVGASSSSKRVTSATTVVFQPA